LIGLSKYKLKDGVYILTPVNDRFEEIYLKVREKEKRIYSDEELDNLPFATANNPHKDEWKIRTESFLKFKKYLDMKSTSMNILDLGSGNGWFSIQLSKSTDHKYRCVDVNLTELKQGAQVAKSDHIKFFYADIFSAEISSSFFDMIIINSAVQYFPDLKTLLKTLLALLKPEGEIHIIDSPFYREKELPDAKQRTINYFSSIGFPEMSENYFHRTWSELSSFSYKILYNPLALKSKVLKFISPKTSPFPWICIKNEGL